MGDLKDFFSIRKNIANLLLLVIVILGLPILVIQAQQRQFYLIKASTNPITVQGLQKKIINNQEQYVTSTPHVQVSLVLPSDFQSEEQQAGLTSSQSLAEKVVNSIPIDQVRADFNAGDVPNSDDSSTFDVPPAEAPQYFEEYSDESSSTYGTQYGDENTFSNYSDQSGGQVTYTPPSYSTEYNAEHDTHENLPATPPAPTSGNPNYFEEYTNQNTSSYGTQYGDQGTFNNPAPAPFQDVVAGTIDCGQNYVWDNSSLSCQPDPNNPPPVCDTNTPGNPCYLGDSSIVPGVTNSTPTADDCSANPQTPGCPSVDDCINDPSILPVVCQKYVIELKDQTGFAAGSKIDPVLQQSLASQVTSYCNQDPNSFTCKDALKRLNDYVQTGSTVISPETSSCTLYEDGGAYCPGTPFNQSCTASCSGAGQGHVSCSDGKSFDLPDESCTSSGSSGCQISADGNSLSCTDSNGITTTTTTKCVGESEAQVTTADGQIYELPDDSCTGPAGCQQKDDGSLFCPGVEGAPSTTSQCVGNGEARITSSSGLDFTVPDETCVGPGGCYWDNGLNSTVCPGVGGAPTTVTTCSGLGMATIGTSDGKTISNIPDESCFGSGSEPSKVTAPIANAPVVVGKGPNPAPEPGSTKPIGEGPNPAPEPGPGKPECNPNGGIDPKTWSYNGLACDTGNSKTKGEEWSCKGTTKFSNDKPAPIGECGNEPPKSKFFYQIAETEAGLGGAPKQQFTGSVNPTYNFADKTPGSKFLFVRFSDDKGKTVDATSDPIYLLGPTPTVTGTACPVDVTGSGLAFTIQGTNFTANQGTLKINGQDIPASQITSWTDNLITATLSNPSSTANGTAYSISVTKQEGTTATGSCTVGISTLKAASLYCSKPNQQTTIKAIQNATLIAYDPTTKKEAKDTVSIDSQGNIQGLKAGLNKNQDYKIGIKTPSSLLKFYNVPISGGTTLLNQPIPFGDIKQDGQVNAADVATMFAQWTLTPQQSSSTLPCDANGDGVCNSLDYACLLKSYGQCDDADPSTGQAPCQSVNATASSAKPAASAAPAASPTTGAAQ